MSKMREINTVGEVLPACINNRVFQEVTQWVILHNVLRGKRKWARVGLKKKWLIVWHSLNAGIVTQLWALPIYLNNANPQAAEKISWRSG